MNAAAMCSLFLFKSNPLSNRERRGNAARWKKIGGGKNANTTAAEERYLPEAAAAAAARDTTYRNLGLGSTH